MGVVAAKGEPGELGAGFIVAQARSEGVHVFDEGEMGLERCGVLVDCAGPCARALGEAMGGDAAALPLVNEVHA